MQSLTRKRATFTTVMLTCMEGGVEQTVRPIIASRGSCCTPQAVCALQAAFRASWLHDLGKMVVPDRTSSVSEVVQPADVAIWSRQLFAAGAIIEAAPALKPAAAFVLASRECVDGTGFPHRLVGEDIPLGARIVHVADTYDALTELCAVFSVSSDSINAELTRHVGTRFDASVVAAWLRCADGAPTPSSAGSGDDAGSLF